MTPKLSPDMKNGIPGRLTRALMTFYDEIYISDW